MSAGRGARHQTVLILLLAAVLGIGTVPPVEGAVSDYLGRPITQVRVEEEDIEVRDQAVLELIETRVGQPLEMTGVRETIGHLFSLGRYEDVQVRASPSGDGVIVVYDLVPLHHVRALEFHGPIEIDESRLRAAITDRLGPTPPVGRAADAVRILEDLYQDEGYRRPVITTSPRVEHRPDRTILIFDIMPGIRTLVGRVTVEGGRSVQSVVLDRIDLRMGEPFRRAALIASLDRYRSELQSQGYYQARVTYLPLRYSADGSTVDLMVIVEAGPLVRLRFEGDPLPDRERAELVPIARQRSADEDLLEDSKRRIENWLRGQGYRDARADYRREQAGDTLEIVMTITRGPLHRLKGVEIVGSSMTPDLQALVRLKEGAPFVDAVFSADVDGMGEFYRRAGFANAKVTSSVLPTEGTGAADRLVTATVTVVEGARSVVGTVTFEGNASIEASRLQVVAGLVSGQPFYEPQTEMAADAIVVEYLNRGYPTARVVRTLTPSDDRTVDVAFRVQEGVQVIIDHILIVGNERTNAEIIERELVLKPGQPLADTDMIESRRRLNALGLFRRVQITDVRHPGQEARRDVLVTVEEALATTIGGGGGAEVGLRLERSAEGGLAEEQIEFAPRGFFEIGRRNLWGKNRSINFFSRVSFRPSGSTSAPDPGAPADSGYGFNEYRVLLTYREPRVFGTTADGLLYGFLEQGVRSSFNFNRRGTRLEVVRRVTPQTTVSGRYTLEQTRRFDERYNQSEEQDIDRVFPEFRLSAVSSSLIRSTRDDAIDPTKGTLTTLDASFAAQAFGSEVGFVEVLIKEFFYRQLPGTGRVVFAGGATMGLARGSSSNIAESPNGETDSEQLTVPASERFYAGGDTTVRGFALDRLGTRDTIDQDGFPTGGQGLVIFNAELRFPVWGDLGGVGFLDVGNVYRKVTAINFGELRGSVGLGVRYRSPIGPVRFDVGFKLSRFDFRTGALNPDGTPETKREPLTGFHISLGQAF